MGGKYLSLGCDKIHLQTSLLSYFKNRENFYQQAKETGTGASMNV
jgi:hypothetical protein